MKEETLESMVERFNQEINDHKRYNWTGIQNIISDEVEKARNGNEDQIKRSIRNIDSFRDSFLSMLPGSFNKEEWEVIKNRFDSAIKVCQNFLINPVQKDKPEYLLNPKLLLVLKSHFDGVLWDDHDEVSFLGFWQIGKKESNLPIKENMKSKFIFLIYRIMEEELFLVKKHGRNKLIADSFGMDYNSFKSDLSKAKAKRNSYLSMPPDLFKTFKSTK